MTSFNIEMAGPNRIADGRCFILHLHITKVEMIILDRLLYLTVAIFFTSWGQITF